VVRDAEGLTRLGDVLATATARPLRCRADVEDAALTVTARAVAVAALQRTESRGCHHRGDHPDPAPAQAVSGAVDLDEHGHVRTKVRADACC
jgi:L-aspartate oxidase